MEARDKTDEGWMPEFRFIEGGGGTVASWARTTFSGSAPTTVLGHVLFDA